MKVLKPFDLHKFNCHQSARERESAKSARVYLGTATLSSVIGIFDGLTLKYQSVCQKSDKVKESPEI
jgi:hypothetical protein